MDYYFNGSHSEEYDPEDEYFSDSETDRHKNNVYEMQLQKFEVFKAQDPKTGYFDVKFEIEGKYIYAHKFTLSSVSETLNAWLSNRWTATNDPIKIETYSFDYFFQFCCFIYSGGCKLTKENIFQIIDAAEFFGIEVLKNYCEKYINVFKRQFVTSENLIDMMDMAEKYSLLKFNRYLERHHVPLFNFKSLLEGDKILPLRKSHLLCLLKARNNYYREAGNELFEALVKWTYHYVSKEKEETTDENFDLEEAMKNEFKDFRRYIRADILDLDKLDGILADKPIPYASSDLVKIFTIERGGDSDSYFKFVYKLAEILANKKQKEADNENFNVNEEIRKNMAEVISVTKFTHLADLVIDFIVEKTILFSYKELLKILAECCTYGPQQKLFECMYKVAEKQVLLNSSDNIIARQEAIKNELIEFLPSVRFSFFKFDELIKLAVEQSFLFNPKQDLYKLLIDCKRSDEQEEQLFKTMYYVAEKEILKHQQLISNDTNAIQEEVKAELIEYLPRIRFYLMSKAFMIDFVVAKGIVTYHQAFEVCTVKVEARSDDITMIGIFDDNFNILDTIGKKEIEILSCHGLKQRFTHFKFSCPSTSSELKKKDEIHWYLCFEVDGVLTVKHKRLIAENDYLIAELKSPDERHIGHFKKGIKTDLKIIALNPHHFQQTVQPQHSHQFVNLTATTTS